MRSCVLWVCVACSAPTHDVTIHGDPAPSALGACALAARACDAALVSADDDRYLGRMAPEAIALVGRDAVLEDLASAA